MSRVSLAYQFQIPPSFFLFFLTVVFGKQCDTFLRLAKESIVHEPVEETADLEALIAEVDDDKSFAAMSVSKTISTVCCSFFLMYALPVLDSRLSLLSTVLKYWLNCKKL